MLIIRGQHVKTDSMGETYLNEEQYFWRISKNTYRMLKGKPIEIGDMAYVAGKPSYDREVLITGIYEVDRDFRPMGNYKADKLRRVLQIKSADNDSRALLMKALT